MREEDEEDDEEEDEEEEEEAVEGDCVSCMDPPPVPQQLASPPQARSRFARRGRSSGETPKPSQPVPPFAPPPATSGSSASKKPPSWWELVCSNDVNLRSTMCAPDNRADASEPRRKKRSASTPASMVL